MRYCFLSLSVICHRTLRLFRNTSTALHYIRIVTDKLEYYFRTLPSATIFIHHVPLIKASALPLTLASSASLTVPFHFACVARQSRLFT